MIDTEQVQALLEAVTENVISAARKQEILDTPCL